MSELKILKEYHFTEKDPRPKIEIKVADDELVITNTESGKTHALKLTAWLTQDDLECWLQLEGFETICIRLRCWATEGAK